MNLKRNLSGKTWIMDLHPGPNAINFLLQPWRTVYVFGTTFLSVLVMALIPFLGLEYENYVSFNSYPVLLYERIRHT